MAKQPSVAALLCGAYLGDNDATCPQLTCIRPKGHPGPHDNVTGDEDAIAAQIEADSERRDQALADMLDDGHPGDEPGLGNSWDWAGGD